MTGPLPKAGGVRGGRPPGDGVCGFDGVPGLDNAGGNCGVLAGGASGVAKP